MSHKKVIKRNRTYRASMQKRSRKSGEELVRLITLLVAIVTLALVMYVLLSSDGKVVGQRIDSTSRALSLAEVQGQEVSAEEELERKARQEVSGVIGVQGLDRGSFNHNLLNESKAPSQDLGYASD